MLKTLPHIASHKAIFARSCLLLSASFLISCGGGSSGNTGTTSVASLPSASAGADFTALEQSSVQLSGSGTDSDGDVVSYAWVQTSGTSVSLSDATAAAPSFTSPIVLPSETLTFTLTVTAGGDTDTDTVDVTIIDGNLPDYAATFVADSLVGDPELVSCTVGGASSYCVSLTLKSSPGGSYVVGPFCPRTITDSADEGGIWIKNGDDTVYDADGNFITQLSTLYDSSWQLYDTVTGEVFFTEGEECQLAAVVDPDESLANHCVECLVSDLESDLTQSYLIPFTPVDAASTTANTSYGIAFSGALLDRSAPLDLIESNNNIAPFDDCGGHINPNVGYHIHAVTDNCFVEIENASGHASQIGVALDGYPIFEQLNGTVEPTDLDQCRGHNSDVATYNLDVDYHYHVNAPGENQILPCLTGETAN